MDLDKYFTQISDDLKVLQGDIQRIIVAQEKKAKDDKKQDSKVPKKELETSKTAKEQFKEISLKSLRPVTTLYKDEKEAKEAQDNPEADFVIQRLNEIFSK